MKRILTILLILCGFVAMSQPSNSGQYIRQSAKYRYRFPIWCDSSIYITTISKNADMSRVVVYDSIRKRLGYKYISSGSTYTAGNGLTLSGTTFYADTTKLASLYGNSWQNGMYLGSDNDRSVRFRTNGLQRAVLDSNGLFSMGEPTSATKFISKFALKSQGTTSATNALYIENSAGQDIFTFGNEGKLKFRGGAYIEMTTSGQNILSTNGLSWYGTWGSFGSYVWDFHPVNNIAPTSGNQGAFSLSATMRSAAGSANYRHLNLAYTINNSGAQSGTATGIFLNATETALNGVTHNLVDLQVASASKFKVTNAGRLTATTLYSNSYTPTITGVTNVSSSIAYTLFYTRVDSVVTVSGQVSITSTANNAQTTFGISLPVASNFTSTGDVGGGGYTQSNSIAGHGLSFSGDATNDRVNVDYYESHTSPDVFNFTFSYKIK